jgi:hypothetical protein
MPIFKVSYFDSSHHRIISDISIIAKNIVSAKTSAIKSIPKDTKIIMLIKEGATVCNAIWYLVECNEWCDSTGKSIK